MNVFSNGRSGLPVAMIRSNVVRPIDEAKVASGGRWNLPTLAMWLALGVVSLAIWTLIARGFLAAFDFIAR